MSDVTLYTVGEAVSPERGLYIERKADAELLKHCLNGDSAHILASRQVGKTSLIVRAMNQLQNHDTNTVFLDLQALGKELTQEEWYNGFITTISDQLRSPNNVAQLWSTCGDKPLGPRLIDFFEELLRTHVPNRLIIFIDEIDLILSLGFSMDDFFMAIRAMHSRRALNPDLRRVAFVLVGVATPGELLRDVNVRRFDIGQHIELTDFTEQEACSLTGGWKLPDREASNLFGGVLEWTGGHPHLTQRLCRLIAEVPIQAWTPAELEVLIRQTFMKDGGRGDDNLSFVKDMLLKRAPHPESALTVLQMYQAIYRQDRKVLDEEQSLLKCHLKLAGIVHRQQDWLYVRNRLYRKVFDGRWIKNHMPPAS